MKKLLLYLVILISSFSFSQEKLAENNPYLKAITLEKTDHASMSFINDAKISWDFSALDTKNVDATIEVATFFDCFNGANGSDIKSQYFILSKEKFNVTGSAQVKHDETGTKCFKWRLILKENGSEKFSEWFYFIYLKE
jgi:hypothetical protein